jgi:hypothetical protein
MNPRIAMAFGAIFVAQFLTGCTPKLDSLTAASGPERTVVRVAGTNLFLSSIVWDAGLASERVVPGGFLGAYLFSVPPGASVGAHPVALRYGTRTSNIVNFDVTAPNPFGVPRIDRVSVVGASFSSGQITPWLYVQGANIDVGAVVQVNGTDVASVAHRALINNLYGVSPAALAYPIYHYLAVIAAPGALTAGDTISVTVRNLDAQVSTAVNYTLPVDAATMDSDGDNLPDTWEINGFDSNGDGTVDIDLKALGADPNRPDIFVEVDVMNGLGNPPIATAGGTPGTFDTVRSMFAAAPILNPTGTDGINIVLDTSGTVAFTATVGFAPIIASPMGTTEFSTLKAANFNDAERGRIYHYAIWGNMMPGGFSGVSDVDFGGTESGDDFLVTFDDFSASFQTLRSQVETFAHELGHGLGQRHGGTTHSQFKPNYPSVMSYAWQLRSGQTNATRRSRTTCTPFYWADSTATEPNGAPPAAISAITDYSEGMLADVVENNASLDETTGVCGLAVFWNGDGDSTDTGLSLDADDNGASNETLRDFGNWRSLNFRGPEQNGDMP